MSTQHKGLPLDFVFPDTGAIFTSTNKPLGEVKDTCAVALDANVLLEPYRLTSASLGELRSIYAGLVQAHRLYVPAQAAREFKKNRPKYLAEVAKALKDERGRLGGKRARIRFLESDPDYGVLTKHETEFDDKRQQILKQIDVVSDKLRSWTDGDPITSMYADVLSQVVYGEPLNVTELEEFQKDLTYRQTYGIPPGFKDANKPDQGAGDLLIWRALLQIGREKKKHLIFVTNEKKLDWRSLNNGEPFLPRPELIEEFRRASGGMSFHIIPFVEFMTAFRASASVVEEIADVEMEVETAIRDAVDFGEVVRLEVEVDRLSRDFERMKADLVALGDNWNNSLSLPWNRAKNTLRLQIAAVSKELADRQARLAELRGNLLNFADER